MNKRNYALWAFLLCMCTAVLIVAGIKFYRSGHVKTVVTDSFSKASSSSEIAADVVSDDDKASEKYDAAAVCKAYLSGKPDSLNDFNRKIYDRAVQIIGMIITDDMSDFDKELAVHDWLVNNCEYDKKALGVFETYSENSDNPYGALINGKAICTGYTLSFQMFMDMLEIPCKTIRAAANDGDDHAWNMVSLDGEWYYVDVTWDDPVPDSNVAVTVHEFFNVTEEKMRNTDHEWDLKNLPDAKSYKYSYPSQTAVYVKNFAEFESAVKSFAERKSEAGYILFAPESGVKLEGSVGDYFEADEDSRLYKSYLHPFEESFTGSVIYCDLEQTEQGLCLAVYLG